MLLFYTTILSGTIQYILAIKRFDIPFTNIWAVLKDSHFWIHMLTLPSPTMVYTRFNDNRLFVFFYCFRYYFRLVIFYLVLFFIKWLHDEFLSSSFCEYISSFLLLSLSFPSSHFLLSFVLYQVIIERVFNLFIL